MKLFTTLFLILFTNSVFAVNGDTTHVISHNQVLVTTNPGGSGWNEYKNWAVFPSEAMSYRKVFVTMSYKCPTGLNCGEWDYIDAIYLRRKGSVDSVSKDIEMVRFITPYGWSFMSSWNFSWKVDITDFGFMLHDSVEIGYVHTGYEASNDRGWVVTLDFNMIEGTPIQPSYGISNLWEGSFTYGSASNPIENYLVPLSKTVGDSTTMTRLRLNHTGHGSDGAGCSEFCEAYRDLLYDGVFVERISRWRECGWNALYPQAGTWVYNRGNWCPGAPVHPYIYDFSVAPLSTHAIDIDMEPYTTSSPSGNEYIFGYLFEYGDPSAANDASIEQILEPNSEKEFGRSNPVCNDPRIIIRNNGTNALTSIIINYGFEGQPFFTYNWSGNLAFAKTDTVQLPGVLIPQSGQTDFMAYLSDVNGTTDEYSYDDTARSVATIPQSFSDTVIVIELKTNNEPAENGWKIIDGYGNVIAERARGTLAAATVYKDTVSVGGGCYRFILEDVDLYGGDGLSWWANSAAGSGYIRMRNLNNSILKSFSNDFGAGIFFSFITGNPFTSVEEYAEVIRDIVIYPNPNNGSFTFDAAFSEAVSFRLEIFDLTGKRIYTENFYETNSLQYPVEIPSMVSGIYFVKVTGDNFVETRKISVAK